MKKFFILFICFILVYCCVYAKTLTGGISYSIDTARKIVFQNIQYKINMEPYKQFFLDKNKDKNLKALAKHKYNFLDRWLTYFSDNEYGVLYKNDPNTSFYYDKDGNLTFIGFRMGDTYPQKSIRYDTRGNLDSLCLIISPEEQFIFDKNKKLSSHWIGNNCYNTNGELIMTRY